MPKFDRCQVIPQLLDVCKRHCLSNKSEAVIPEPYIPFLPKKWNGILVLAESQNLSDTNADYVSWLKQQNKMTQFQRLGALPRRPPPLGNRIDSQHWEERIDIQPWDDGPLQLAMAAVFPDLPIETFGVSNAVVWSQRAENGTNSNPSKNLIAKSSAFWREILDILQPNRIVCAGVVAKIVIGPEWRPLALRLPSPMNINRIVSLFDTKDLLRRFPEVAEALERNPQFNDGRYQQNRIFFACHAVSLAGKGR